MRVLKPVRLAGTRWILHMKQALHVLLKGYEVIRSHLEHVRESWESSAEVLGRATYLVKKLQDYRVLRYMFLLLDILDIVSVLSKSFQRDDVMVNEYVDALVTANLELVQLTQQNGPIFP